MSCSDDDYGKLLIGEWQVNTLLGRVHEGDWSIALLHHPWSWLAPFDAVDVEAPVRRDCHVVLRGHLHQQRAHALCDVKDTCIELTTGSVYSGSKKPNAFQLIELHPGERRVSVHFWLWREGRWIGDDNAYPGTHQNVATLDLEAQVVTPGSQPRPSAADPAKYLHSLQEGTAHIDIRGLRVTSGKAQRFPIHELYIPLTTSYHGKDERAKRKKEDQPADLGAGRDRRIELDEALASQRLAIVGDPGAGKTTFLRRIANVLCCDRLGAEALVRPQQLGIQRGSFPILISLAKLAEHIARFRGKEGPAAADSPAWLPHFLATHSREYAWGLDETFFSDHLTNGTAVILLDGLDETSTDLQRRSLATLVQQASEEAYPDCRFVLTSRPGAYQGEATLPGFTQARIDALEPEAIGTFLSRWCAALFPTEPTRRQEHLTELQTAVQARLEIRRMAANASLAGECE